MPTFGIYAAQIDGTRFWSSPDTTRLVFEISSPIKYSLMQLTHPDRVVIDLQNTSLSQPLPQITHKDSVISQIRSSSRNHYDYRIVLDLKTAAVADAFLLKPTASYGHRLVLDLKSHDNTKSVVQNSNPVLSKSEPTDNVTIVKRQVIVAIDAGHGGEDPGALGPRGTKEKDVVLAISRQLQSLLNNEYGITPVMIRQDDYYVSLRGRIKQARVQKADLFVSIHADAVRNRHAQGASVFVLSQKAATNEAVRWLETTQNNTDLLGGVSLDDKEDVLASVLLDLSQTATLAASVEIGSSVLSQLKSVGNLHKDEVAHAGFVVLKSPDIPSILVETGFISNRNEEQKLKNRKYQSLVASAIYAGIKRYFSVYPPPGSLLASKEIYYKAKQGDTLSAIAQQYAVSVYNIRVANALRNDGITTGQILRIPVNADSES